LICPASQDPGFPVSRGLFLCQPATNVGWRIKAPKFAHKLSKLVLILKALAKLGGSVYFMPFAQKASKILHICGKTFLAFEIVCKPFIFNVFA
jgi:hypothetical protein